MSGHQHHFTSQHRQQSKKTLSLLWIEIYPHPKLQISVYFIEKYFRFSTENTYIELRSADTESVICNVQWPVLWSVSSPTNHQSSWHWGYLRLVCKEMFSSLIGHINMEKEIVSYIHHWSKSRFRGQTHNTNIFQHLHFIWATVQKIFPARLFQIIIFTMECLFQAPAFCERIKQRI